MRLTWQIAQKSNSALPLEACRSFHYQAAAYDKISTHINDAAGQFVLFAMNTQASHLSFRVMLMSTRMCLVQMQCHNHIVPAGPCAWFMRLRSSWRYGCRRTFVNMHRPHTNRMWYIALHRNHSCIACAA